MAGDRCGLVHGERLEHEVYVAPVQRNSGCRWRTNVAIPEKINIPTKVHVEMTPKAEEKERKRNGTKLVGMILPK